MAYNTKSKQRKMEPAIMSMFFEVPFADGVSESGGALDYIDLSQCASIVNRRFYRQGINWAVAGFRIHTAPDTSGTVSFYKVQSTWQAFNSWKKSFALWTEMNDLVLDNQPSIKPAFLDFKVFMDNGHINEGFNANLIPYVESMDTNNEITIEPYLKGNWEHTLITMPNDDAALPPDTYKSYRLKFHGIDSSTSKAMIQGYADSRSVPQDPDPETQAGADTGWMNLITDYGEINEEVAFNLQTRGDDLPYDQFEYPGGGLNAGEPSLHAIAKVSPTTIGGNTSASGGMFPCGLIKVHNTLAAADSSVTAFALEVLLVPGSHRGYLCEKMQEV